MSEGSRMAQGLVAEDGRRAVDEERVEDLVVGLRVRDGDEVEGPRAVPDVHAALVAAHREAELGDSHGEEEGREREHDRHVHPVDAVSGCEARADAVRASITSPAAMRICLQ